MNKYSISCKAETAGEKNAAILNITCLYCGKKYSIKAARIPPGVKTTPCKACGRPMSLVVPTPAAAGLNVPSLLAAVDQNTAEDKKNNRYKMTATIIKSLGLTDIALYFYAHPQHAVLPVIFASGEDGNNLKALLTSQINNMQVLESQTDGLYRIRKDAIPADKQNSFPIDRKMDPNRHFSCNLTRSL